MTRLIDADSLDAEIGKAITAILKKDDSQINFGIMQILNGVRICFASYPTAILVDEQPTVEQPATYVKFDLKRYRKKNHLTMQNVADAMGITQSAISQFESGGSVRKKTILKIANALGIDPMELFLDENGRSAKELGVVFDLGEEENNEC